MLPADCARVYSFRRVLGRGGAGAVALAEHVGLGRLVAVKVLEVRGDVLADAHARFRREMHVTAALTHPNIVKVLDHGDDCGVPWIAYEYMTLGSLRDRLDRSRLDLRDTLEIMRGVTLGLSAAHAAGVIHRDVKPENVLLGPGGAVKLGDFGIAWSSVSRSIETADGVVLGTPAYLAPELIRGSPPSVASDLYAVAAVFFELLTGRPPFEAGTLADLLRQHLAVVPPLVSQLSSDVPPWLTASIARNLSKDPSLRDDDLSPIIALLERETQGTGLAGNPPARPLPRPQEEPSPRRLSRPLLILAAGIPLLTLFTLAAFHRGASVTAPLLPARVSPSASRNAPPEDLPAGFGANELRQSLAPFATFFLQQRSTTGGDSALPGLPYPASDEQIERCVSRLRDLERCIERASNAHIVGDSWLGVAGVVNSGLDLAKKCFEDGRPRQQTTLQNAVKSLILALEKGPDDPFARIARYVCRHSAVRVVGGSGLEALSAAVESFEGSLPSELLATSEWHVVAGLLGLHFCLVIEVDRSTRRRAPNAAESALHRRLLLNAARMTIVALGRRPPPRDDPSFEEVAFLGASVLLHVLRAPALQSEQSTSALSQAVLSRLRHSSWPRRGSALKKELEASRSATDNPALKEGAARLLEELERSLRAQADQSRSSQSQD